jgi:alpha-1,2-glucosyltransferase
MLQTFEKRLLKIASHPRFTVVMLVALFVALTGLFFIMKDMVKKVDETYHHLQVVSFVRGNYSLNLTTIPGYHIFASIVSRIFNQTSLPFVRGITFTISLLSIGVFYLLSKRETNYPLTKTLQFALLPLMLPFFFLVYTDTFSALLILLSLAFVFQNRMLFAAGFGILSMLVRQNNIVWFVSLYAMYYWKTYGIKLSREAIKKELTSSWLYAIGIIGFIIFVILNKGVTLADHAYHPSFSFNLGNIYFLLFLFFFLFLPLHISNAKQILSLLKKRAVYLSLLILFIFYLFTFQVTHPYNTTNTWYLRNWALVFFSSTIIVKTIFFVPIALSILSLRCTQLLKKEYYILYPFTFLFLIPSWLIEQRYYIVPIILFILFKKDRSMLVEYSTIILFGIISLYFLYGIRVGMFFL